jgi:hypothetical protein
MTKAVMIACFLPMVIEASISKGFGVETSSWIRAVSGAPAGGLAAWGVWIALSETVFKKRILSASKTLSFKG